MATIMCIPDEVISIILGYNMSIEDIINFRCVWKQVRSTAKYDKYWEKIFYQRWPSTKKLYDKQSKEKDSEQKDSKKNEQKDKKSLNFMETGINSARQLRDYVSQIIHKHYYNNESIDNLTKFEDVFRLDNNLLTNIDEIINKPENFIKYSFFIDEIKNLLTQSPRRTGCDLTERYCNTKIFHYMRECSVRKKWYRFKKQEEREQLLERIATIMAQQIQLQKDVFYSYVKASLDSIAQEVLNCLREKYPDHSIFSTSAETFSYWKSNNIHNNHWNEEEGTQIMDTLEEYIFGKLNFRPSKLEDTNLEYMCIDYVLKHKHGQGIILLIIYHSVARRLGLRCDILSLESHFRNSQLYRFRKSCIFWKPEYVTNNLENVRCFNISFKKFPDCFVNQLSLFRTLSRGRSINFATISASMMWYEMKDLFAYLINHCNKPYGTNPSNYGYDLIKRNLMVCFKEKWPFNTRPKDVKYAVGMIVTHNDQSTDNCAGVIIGWHTHIDTYMVEMSKFYVRYSWSYDMYRDLSLNHCRNFNFTNQQTNYIILTENNKICYVEEATITLLTTPKWIDNSEIGRYFCKFKDTHYVPNKMLARLYPQDAAITAQTIISKN